MSKWSNFMPIFTRAGEYQRVHLPRPQLAVAASETRRKKPSMENEWTSSFFTKTIQYDPIIRSWSFFLFFFLFFSSKFWQVNSVNSKHLAVLSISHLESPWRRTNPEQLASTVLVLGWEACTWGNEAGGNTPDTHGHWVGDTGVNVRRFDLTLQNVVFSQETRHIWNLTRR